MLLDWRSSIYIVYICSNSKGKACTYASSQAHSQFLTDVGHSFHAIIVEAVLLAHQRIYVFLSVLEALLKRK